MNRLKSWSIMMLFALMLPMWVACNSDDNNEGDDLSGYWVKEGHLNNPERGNGGYVSSTGYHFLGNGEVKELLIQHTGHSSKYSGAEASTSWEVLTVRNGVTFYINPSQISKTYQRAGNEIVIDALSDPVMMTITGTDRIVSTSSSGYSDGVYVRIR